MTGNHLTMTNEALEVIKTISATDGVQLEYEVLGEGEPLVILHGVFAGRGAFSRQRELAERYRLILPSFRGHDNSGKDLPTGYGIATSELRDLCSVLDAEGVQRCHLIGHSSGGAVAFAFARSFPTRVERLVLIEPSVFGILHGPEREAIAATLGTFIEAGRVEGDLAGLRTVLAYMGGEAWATLEDAKREARLQAMAPMGHLTAPHFQALLDFQVTDADVKDLPTPTLLIYGGASYAFQRHMAGRFCELRPDWPLVIIEGAGHNSFREKPALVNDAIENFISEGVAGP